MVRKTSSNFLRKLAKVRMGSAHYHCFVSYNIAEGVVLNLYLLSMANR